jgi:hypothetical protein
MQVESQQKVYMGLPVKRYETGYQHRFRNMVYLSALQDLQDEYKAESISELWYNIHFLGSGYSQKVHQTVEKYTPKEYLDYKRKRD